MTTSKVVSTSVPSSSWARSTTEQLTSLRMSSCTDRCTSALRDLSAPTLATATALACEASNGPRAQPTATTAPAAAAWSRSTTAGPVRLITEVELRRGSRRTLRTCGPCRTAASTTVGQLLLPVLPVATITAVVVVAVADQHTRLLSVESSRRPHQSVDR